MKKFSDDYLAIMKSRSEVSFVEDTIASDLWKLLAGLLDYPIMINTSVSHHCIIRNEEDLKYFVYQLLHPEEDES
jgi:hypothetical protein